MTTHDNQIKIISLISEVKRKGIDNLIKFIKDSDYLTTAQCHTHHNCPHGLMMHSLEVLDTMLRDNLAGVPRESIILTSLCHDLGMASINGESVDGVDHPQRSIEILNQCGLELTEDERDAILNHHPAGFDEWFASAFKTSLCMLLQVGDGISIDTNKSGSTYRFTVL